jgi:hypothetical protein
VVTTEGSPATAIITVDYAVADGDYDLVLRSAAGTSQAIGTMTVHEGHGAWRGTIDAAGNGASLAMVDSQGTVVCHAALAS